MFGVTSILDNPNIVQTTSYSFKSTLDQEITHLVTLITIQTWHPQIDYFSYQTIFCLPRVADGIEVKKHIQRNIFDD